MMTSLDDNNPAENSFDDNVDTIQSSPIVVHDQNDKRPRRNTGSWKDGPAGLREVYISKIFWDFRHQPSILALKMVKMALNKVKNPGILYRDFRRSTRTFGISVSVENIPKYLTFSFRERRYNFAKLY